MSGCQVYAVGQASVLINQSDVDSLGAKNHHSLLDCPSLGIMHSGQAFVCIILDQQPYISCHRPPVWFDGTLVVNGRYEQQ